MKIIRTDKIASCEECGWGKELVVCTLLDGENVLYCNPCLNKFEKDEENYTITE